MGSSRVGRNDQCPCGSGRKFKKCCLHGDRQLMSREDELIIGGRSARIIAMREVAEETIARCRQRDDWNMAEFEADKVRITIEEIEHSAKQVLSKPYHSRQYWFVLIRRLSNLFWEELQESTGNELVGWKNPVPLLAGKLTLLATGDEEPAEWIEKDGQEGISYEDLGHSELIAVAKVFSLAAALFDAESKYRFASKGFQVFSTVIGKNALDSQDTTSIELYEKRRNEFGTLSGSAGLWYDPLETSVIDRDLCLWYGVIQVRPNTLYIRSVNPSEKIPLQYLLILASEHYARKLDFERRIPFDRLILDDDLSSAFEEGFSIEPRELVAFLYCISRFIYSILRFPRLDYGEMTVSINWQDEEMSFRRKVLHHWRDVASLGMLRSSKEAWIEALLCDSSEIHRYDSSIRSLDYTKMNRLVDQFTWFHGDSVFDNEPRLFIRLSRKTLALDTTWLGDFLRHVLFRAGIASRQSDKMSDGTGPWFEFQAKSFFVRELSLSDAQVVFQRNVKDEEGKEEIDLAFVVNRCLFVIDCKAMSKTADYMIGHYSLLRNRRTEQLKQLKKRNPARIRKIEAGLTQDKIRPEDFDKAYGLVCTTDVEYLPIEESDLWIKDHPCVGPPDELLCTIKSIVKDASEGAL